MKKLLTLILLLNISLFGASFDCKKASGKVEKMICADTELSALDENLSKAFKEALTSTDDRDQLKKEQFTWMRERNKCQDVSCVQSMYSSKIHTLNISTKEGDLNAKKYLKIGDDFFASYEKNKNIEDKTKGIEAYKKYVEQLRIQNPIPKVPFRVVEEVYLKHKIETPYPDVWGDDFRDFYANLTEETNNKFLISDIHSSTYYLKNNDFLIRFYHGKNNQSLNKSILYFAQIEVDDNFYMNNKYVVSRYLSNKKRLAKLDDCKGLVQEPIIPICESIYPEEKIQEKNHRRVLYDYARIPFRSQLALEDQDKSSETKIRWISIVGLNPRKSIGKFTYDSDQTFSSFARDYTTSSLIYSLNDGTYLIVGQDGWVLRIDKFLRSKASFFNKSIFIVDSEELGNKAYLHLSTPKNDFKYAEGNIQNIYDRVEQLMNNKIKLGEQK